MSQWCCGALWCFVAMVLCPVVVLCGNAMDKNINGVGSFSLLLHSVLMCKCLYVEMSGCGSVVMRLFQGYVLLNAFVSSYNLS